MQEAGITACLANIPGTAAAAATVVDGYPLARKGRGAEAVGYTLYSSIFACVASMIIVFFIQPFVATVALKFGNWEVFLFCLFGLIIVGSLVGKDVVRGWISMSAYCERAMISSFVMRLAFAFV